MFDNNIGIFNVRSFSTPDGIRRAIKICRTHHTYSTYGAMQYWINSPDNIQNIIFLIREGFPIGTLMVLKINDRNYACNCGTWVYPEWRKLGVGRYLMEKANQMRLKLKPWTGTYQSKAFYEKTWSKYERTSSINQ